MKKQDLIDSINCEYIGKDFPYVDNDLDQIELFINTIIEKIKAHTGLIIDDYTNTEGFSSFMEYKVHRLGAQQTEDLGKEELEKYTGLAIYVSKTFPAYTISNCEWEVRFKKKTFWKKRHYISSIATPMEPEDAGKNLTINLAKEIELIKSVFYENKITFLSAAELNQPLNFDIDIPTILNTPPYKVFDCLFYWED